MSKDYFELDTGDATPASRVEPEPVKSEPVPRTEYPRLTREQIVLVAYCPSCHKFPGTACDRDDNKLSVHRTRMEEAQRIWRVLNPSP